MGLYDFKAGDRVQMHLGDELMIGTITGTSPNPHYDLKMGSRYPDLYDVLWDGDRAETKGYLPFLLDRHFQNDNTQGLDWMGDE